MRDMYIESDYDDPKKKKLHMDVPEDSMFSDLAIGEQVAVVVTGTICGLRAPQMRKDYSVDVKEGKQRPLKRHPGTLDLEITESAKLNKVVPAEGIDDLNAMLMADDIGVND